MGLLSRRRPVIVSTVLAVFWSSAHLGQSSAETSASTTTDYLDCCEPPYSYFDCTGNGHAASPGKLYKCVNTVDLTGCMSCLGTMDDSIDVCTTCCSAEGDGSCTTTWSDWEFYASTLFFVCLCCCFSLMCGFIEVRRKRKGISFAQAWSVPQAMPILRTWPRRSVSASDIVSQGEGTGQQWSVLSDDGEDSKRFPVAGLVDDSGMAFGFMTSLPQSLLSTVAASIRRSASSRNAHPPSPQEPELTVYLSRDHQEALVEVGAPSTAVEATTEEGSGGGRAVVVGNDLQEPLMFEDDNRPDRRNEGGESSGGHNSRTSPRGGGDAVQV